MLLDRNHSRHRWENQPAVGVRLEDLDREEIGLRVDGEVTQAAQMLYGTRFLPDYPQALLKLGRFWGTKITGDILDNEQEYLHAFAMVREAIAWLDRTLPLSARFPKGSILREDRLPVTAEALREIIINAAIDLRDLAVRDGEQATHATRFGAPRKSQMRRRGFFDRWKRAGVWL